MHISVETTDLHRAWTIAGGLYVMGAAALAVIGLPPIDWHSPLHYLGIMDPACGGTRATLALTHLDLATAWRYNPGVPFLAVILLAATVRAGVGLVTKRWLTLSGVRRRTVIVVAVILLAALEVRQQLHADLLTQWGIQGSG